MKTRLRTLVTVVMSIFTLTILLDSVVLASSDQRAEKECKVHCEIPDSEPDVNLSWTAPTVRLDGEYLSVSELEGYRIYYGTDSNNLVPLVDLNDSSITSYSIYDLNAGTYYFTITAYDDRGLESGYSDIVNKQVL